LKQPVSLPHDPEIFPEDKFLENMIKPVVVISSLLCFLFCDFPDMGFQLQNDLAR
jgi:hypothetical protein